MCGDKMNSLKIADTRFGFIGVGIMGNIILSALCDKCGVDAKNVALFDKFSEKLAPLSEKGFYIASSASEVREFADVVFLAVKPQDIKTALSGFSSELKSKPSLAVSMAAGISGTLVHELFGGRVVRIMPNTPLVLGKGAVAVAKSVLASDDDVKLIMDIFSVCAVVSEVQENKMNEIIAVNGSSPAYFYLILECMAKWAERSGISYDEALKLSAATMIGSAEMVLSQNKPVSELKAAITSKGGTTFAALDVLEKELPNIIDASMNACTRRAYELSQQ